MAITSRARRAGLVKAGGASNYVQGMDSAVELLAFLEGFGGKIAGCIMAAKRREGGGNNQQILEYLAEPKAGPSRDLRPTAEDRAEANGIIRTGIIAKLQMISKKGKPLARWDESRRAQFVASGRREADKIAAFVLRRAGKAMKARMVERANGGGYDKVSKEYADWRQRKYGVDKGAVFRATGQLLSNINDGSIRLITKPTLAQLVKGFANDLVDAFI